MKDKEKRTKETEVVAPYNFLSSASLLFALLPLLEEELRLLFNTSSLARLLSGDLELDFLLDLSLDRSRDLSLL